MKKEADKGNLKEQSWRVLWFIAFGSLLFFIVSVIISGVIIYFSYLFNIPILKIFFMIILTTSGIVMYYILITEFLIYYNRKVR